MDDALELKRLDELSLRAGRSGRAQYTRFLEPSLLRAAEAAAGRHDAGVLLYGGYPEAERVMAAFYGDEPPETTDFPLRVLRIEWNAKFASPGHRDLLGALMGLGLKREAVGDLLVGEGSADLLLLPELSAFVMDNLQQAGREKLHIAELSLKNLHFPTPKRKLLRESVPSLRLDAVLCAAFGLSRAKASELIRAGRVSVNHRCCLRPDLSLEAGALLSCRGAGKARLAEIGNLTRKGRVSVTIERFV